MRIGFAVKVLGKDDVKSHDARRHASNPHLRESIKYAHGVFDYLGEVGISMYRFSSDFAPYLTHPDMPQFHNQLVECRSELEELGARARAMNLRLSFHPSQYIILNAPSEKLVETSMRDFAAQAEILDIMGMNCEAVIVTHVGGVYGDPDAAMQRFVDNHKKLGEPARRRLVLENDDKSYGVRDTLKIHEGCGIRLIWDHQHHTCCNPNGMSYEEACCASLNTWPDSCRPKIHFSSPRQENRTVMRVDKETGKKKAFECAALPTQHADYIDEETFIPFARDVLRDCREFDVMVEAKSKDLAVFKLKEDLARAGGFNVE